MFEQSSNYSEIKWIATIAAQFFSGGDNEKKI